MNVLVWILQVTLAFLYVSGGAYKVFKVEDLASHFKALPRGGWRALGIIEVIGGILIVLPASLTRMPALTTIAAAVLALETLVIAWFYGRKSVKLVAANPFVWAATMGLLAVLVALGRFPA